MTVPLACSDIFACSNYKQTPGKRRGIYFFARVCGKPTIERLSGSRANPNSRKKNFINSLPQG
jgi:hypothetical protein